MSRCLGGTWLTTRSPMAISPPEMFSSPAIMRSSVDLPQPDGPTSTVNELSGMSMLTPCSTSTSPKRFLTDRIDTLAIRDPRAAHHGNVDHTPGAGRARIQGLPVVTAKVV